MFIPFKAARTSCLLASLAMLGFAAQPQEVACGMKLSFNQNDSNAPKGITPVWADADGNLMFIDKLNVNTDGTRRSYSVSDFWGEGEAVNNLCNAMSDACAGLSNAELKQRRVSTQAAAAAGWPKDQLAATRISSSIIPFKNGKPCPEVGGYLVSATALHKAVVSEVCDLSNYVDALITPAVVIPKDPPGGQSEFSRRNVRVGDLVTAIKVGAADSFFGVVGDTGPVGSLGEASIAMNGKLLGKTGPPANYLEVRGKPPFQGKGWVTPATFVLIFAASRNAGDPFMSPERIDPAVTTKFAAWGGAARANACMKDYLRKAV